MTWDQAATAPSADFVLRQVVEGIAVGDLNNDGFGDIVHVSAEYIPSTKLPLISTNQKWGSVFDARASDLPTFTPIGLSSGSGPASNPRTVSWVWRSTAPATATTGSRSAPKVPRV